MQIKNSGNKPVKQRALVSLTIASVSMASSAIALLIPYMIPAAAQASRSQTASPNISNIAAAAGGVRNAVIVDDVSPPADPPQQSDKSTDKGFSSEDFLPGNDTKRKPTIKAVAPPSSVNLRVRVSVPQNTDPVDQFVAYPYPMPLPIPKYPPGTKTTSSGGDKPIIPQQAYAKMPSTRKNIRSLILQTGYSARTKRSVAYPSGGWRWQMAYRNALKRCRLDEPGMITEIYPFIDAMEPLVREECKKFDELEEDRQRRYQAAYEEWQTNRADFENDAVKKGYFPVEFMLNKGWRGQKSAAEIRLGPGTWWITGTHKVAGLCYYWQQPVEIVNGQIETVDLNWQNALVIEGGW